MATMFINGIKLEGDDAALLASVAVGIARGKLGKASASAVDYNVAIPEAVLPRLRSDLKVLSDAYKADKKAGKENKDYIVFAESLGMSAKALRIAGESGTSSEKNVKAICSKYVKLEKK